jgi:hypothetical protein
MPNVVTSMAMALPMSKVEVVMVMPRVAELGRSACRTTTSAQKVSKLQDMNGIGHERGKLCCAGQQY